MDVRRRDGDAKPGEGAQAFMEHGGVGPPLGDPLGQMLEHEASDGGLHLGEPVVGAGSLAHPAEGGGPVCVAARLRGTLAVVLVGPHGLPEVTPGGGDHAALAAGGQDLVLAEGEAADDSHAADGPAPVEGAVGLGAVLDDRKASVFGEGEDAVHLAGPASEVHEDDRLGPTGEHRRDCLRSQVLAIAVDVGEDGRGASKEHAAR